jgi:membrane glycosyltransferase
MTFHFAPVAYIYPIRDAQFHTLLGAERYQALKMAFQVRTCRRVNGIDSSLFGRRKRSSWARAVGYMKDHCRVFGGCSVHMLSRLDI